MSVEVKSKLSDDECANRNRANQRAWDAKHVEQRRLYRISYVRRQKQALAHDAIKARMAPLEQPTERQTDYNIDKRHKYSALLNF